MIVSDSLFIIFLHLFYNGCDILNETEDQTYVNHTHIHMHTHEYTNAFIFNTLINTLLLRNEKNK